MVLTCVLASHQPVVVQLTNPFPPQHRMCVHSWSVIIWAELFVVFTLHGISVHYSSSTSCNIILHTTAHTMSLSLLSPSVSSTASSPWSLSLSPSVPHHQQPILLSSVTVSPVPLCRQHSLLSSITVSPSPFPTISSTASSPQSSSLRLFWPVPLHQQHSLSSSVTISPSLLSPPSAAEPPLLSHRLSRSPSVSSTASSPRS